MLLQYCHIMFIKLQKGTSIIC